MTQWVKKIRALPSNPTSNDFLKIEYIDINLNNSRKLIASVSSVAEESSAVNAQTEESLESLLRLRNTRNELSFLDGLVETKKDGGDKSS